MKFLEKISRKVGFTEIESRIIFFLLVTLFVGIIINLVKESGNPELLEFDYAKEDSTFISAGTLVQKEDTVEKITEKRVDSKLELLDFRTDKNAENKVRESFNSAVKVNINDASIDVLSQLPGIGSKTAQNILDYRSKFGRFKKIDDLLDVKGVGKAKFEKIRSHITVN